MSVCTSSLCRILATLLLIVTITGGCKDTTPDDNSSNPNFVILKESDLPAKKLYLLNQGDVVEYVLPSGRHLRWEAEVERFAICEQTTACGLKAHTQQPALNMLNDYGVSTSGRHGISIYRFEIDGYRVERAEDLLATHCLPVAIRVFPVGKEKDLDHEAVRAFFTKNVTVASQPLRVPISTVHHGLNQISPFPVRLVAFNNEICFQVSGDVFRMKEVERRVRLATLMNYVVERLKGIDRISSFSIEVLKGDEVACHYDARKNLKMVWALHKR